MSYLYKKGSIPIILVSLHGGTDSFDCKPRTNKIKGKEFISSNDMNTKEIATQAYKHMVSKNLKPYLLVNNVHRKYVDLNRQIRFACSKECKECLLQYVLFHDILMKTVQEVLAKHGKCFIFDIHGNKSSKNIIEFGYGLTIKQLKNNELKNSSLFSYNGKNIAQYLYKNKSLSKYYSELFPNMFPTLGKIDDSYLRKTRSRYFNGKQLMINKYSKLCDIVLVELSSELRESPILTGTKLAEGLINYYNEVYSK